MAHADIDLALSLIARRLPHLRLPRRLQRAAFPASSRCLGQYLWITDTVRLNARYLDTLDDTGALDLLDTLLHELLHRHSPPMRQWRDSLRPHPRIHAEAGRLARLLAAEFRALRVAAELA